VATCRRLGLETALPEAGLYVWPRVPEGMTAGDFALQLLDRAAVAVTPGTNFGAGGEGYVRIALTVPDAQLEEALARLDAIVARRG
jgi:LL-diaminopimelate aminotransferase